MTEEISKKIDNISFIMTLLIVFLHSLIDTDYYIFKIIAKLIRTFCDIAVPTFFSISAFLLFKKGKKTYFQKIISRIKSLILPYLMWSSIFYLIYLIMSLIPSLSNSLNNNYVEFSLFGLIKSILLCKYVPQLWYMRILFELVVISYLFDLILKKINKYISLFIIIALTITNFIFSFPTVSVLTWLPLFWFIAWITFYSEENIYHFFSKKNNDKYYRYYILIFIIIGIIISHFDIYSNIYYIWRNISPLLIIVIIMKTNINFNKNFNWLSNEKFYIFTMHYFSLLIIRTFLLKLIPINMLNICLVYILSVIGGIIIPVIFANLLKCINIKIYYILNGKRGNR